jgi:hypothetical protein
MGFYFVLFPHPKVGKGAHLEHLLMGFYFFFLMLRLGKVPPSLRHGEQPMITGPGPSALYSQVRCLLFCHFIDFSQFSFMNF